ncbi:MULTISPECIES: DUF4365 domain-containing protein [unclassified Massilia]|uniref:DUF4365 domain-containing protein n=1 Tax=unclassified Massilia TaxID=2609279 RepID=UPI001781F260|nr:MULTISPECIES: DUF4365 domain-containing protein [unclassified Massilia]MBD8532022.1 DUF4365 domain-containing protein [Massilia sp. CFBP 13647]MBD8675468.1 DUF4365 domain-containing protein [Massilia sp. CFBP 13721]
MRTNADFPIADRNRFVKEASEILFKMVKPANWHTESLAGDNDFGLDLQVQVSSATGVQHAFYVQLKGTEHPDITADKSALRYSLKRSTLNYYASIPQEVMLVVCIVALDSSGALNIAGSQVHWEWMADILKQRRGSAFGLDLSEIKTTTVHIPVRQVISRDLDVSARLETRIKQLRFAASLENIFASSNTALDIDPLTALTQWAEAMHTKREHFVALVLGNDDSSTNDVPPKAVEIRALIRAGQTSAAKTILEKLGPDGLGTSEINRAIWLNLCGRVAMQHRRPQDALQLFQAAYETNQCEENLLSLVETKFLKAIDENRLTEVPALKDSLKLVKTDDGFALLVRILVLLKHYQEAESCIERISPPRQMVSKLILLASQAQWNMIIELALQVSHDRAIPENDQIAIQLLAARAAWSKALEALPATALADETPLSGPVGIKHETVKIAWQFALACLDGLRASGWPLNIELLAPIVCAAAGVIGLQQVAIAILSEAGDARPEYQELHYYIELLAISVGDSATALKSNLRQNPEGETLVRRTGIFFQLGRYTDSAQCALEVAKLSSATNQNVGMALAMGYASARKISRFEIADLLNSRIKIDPKGTEFLAFADFAFVSVDQPKSEASLDALRSGLQSVPDSWFLAANLYTNLNLEVPSQATEAVHFVVV